MFCRLSKIMLFFLYGITDQKQSVENAENPVFLKKQEKHINAAKSVRGEEPEVVAHKILYRIQFMASTQNVSKINIE